MAEQANIQAIASRTCALEFECFYVARTAVVMLLGRGVNTSALLRTYSAHGPNYSSVDILVDALFLYAGSWAYPGEFKFA
eukprot:6205757-Pleurochrysis_carterae.AAC.2